MTKEDKAKISPEPGEDSAPTQEEIVQAFEHPSAEDSLDETEPKR